MLYLLSYTPNDQLRSMLCGSWMGLGLSLEPSSELARESDELGALGRGHLALEL